MFWCFGANWANYWIKQKTKMVIFMLSAGVITLNVK